jgi:hypothetical protein
VLKRRNKGIVRKNILSKFNTEANPTTSEFTTTTAALWKATCQCFKVEKIAFTIVTHDCWIGPQLPAAGP